MTQYPNCKYTSCINCDKGKCRALNSAKQPCGFYKPRKAQNAPKINGLSVDDFRIVCDGSMLRKSLASRKF